jgi:serine/threonine protein phosphatase PrpC
MNYATTYDVGDRKRETGINEDSVAITVFEHGHREGVRGQTGADAANGSAESTSEGPANKSAAVFALADGAGGHDAGDVASYIASTVICEELAPVALRASRADPDVFDVSFETPLPDSPDPQTLEAAVDEAIVTAHRRILEYAADSDVGAYTTAVAGIAIDGQLHYGWVGDSRAYVLNREHDEIARLTKDHAVVEKLQDAGQIDDVEAHVHPRGNEITRAIGGTPGENPEEATVAVETATIDLFAEDVVLVTSDGLIDAQTDAGDLYDHYVENDRSPEAAAEVRDNVVTDEHIREWVLEADSLDDAASTLVDRSNERGGKDNLSTILFQDPSLESTPAVGEMPVRAMDAGAPVEDRETIIIPDE